MKYFVSNKRQMRLQKLKKRPSIRINVTISDTIWSQCVCFFFGEEGGGHFFTRLISGWGGYWWRSIRNRLHTAAKIFSVEKTAADLEHNGRPFKKQQNYFFCCCLQGVSDCPSFCATKYRPMCRNYISSHPLIFWCFCLGALIQLNFELNYFFGGKNPSHAHRLCRCQLSARDTKLNVSFEWKFSENELVTFNSIKFKKKN